MKLSAHLISAVSQLPICILLLSIILAGWGCGKSEPAPTLEKLAESGCAKSCAELGEYLFQGSNGHEKDLVRAGALFKIAAEKGDVFAQYRLGRMHFRGEGVLRDYEEAIVWTQKSAEAGHPLAQFNLARAYYYGEGVEADYIKAHEWYLKAAEQGDAVSQFRLGRMYYRGEGAYQDFAAASRWYRRSAEQGYEKAQRALAEMYLRSEGLPQNLNESLFWYSLAAMQNEAAAESRDRVAAMLKRKDVEETTTRALQSIILQAQKE